MEPPQPTSGEMVPPFFILAIHHDVQRKIDKALASAGVAHGGWESMRTRVELRKKQIQTYCQQLQNYLGDDLSRNAYVVCSSKDGPSTAELLARETLREHLAELKNDWVTDLLYRSKLGSRLQPIVDLRTGRIVGDEYLLLGEDEFDRVSPGAVFAAAKGAGLLRELDWQLFVGHLKTAAENQRHAHPQVREEASMRIINVNLYQDTIRTPSFVADTSQLLDELRLSSQQINVEISEEESVDAEALERLRRLGFEYVFDDLGGGGARDRLVDVRRHRPAFVKLDIDIGRGLAANEGQKAFALDVVKAAHENNAKVIAEGLETAADVRCAVELGVDMAQANIFAAPSSQPVYTLEPRAAALVAGRFDHAVVGIAASAVERAG